MTCWGFTEAHTWIDRRYGPDDPLLFDEQSAATPAFDGVFEALSRILKASVRPES